MGFWKELFSALGVLRPARLPGRPGEMDGQGGIYCPIYGRWVGMLTHIETSGDRGHYAGLDQPDLDHLGPDYLDIHKAVKYSGRKFPQDLREVVILCEFCDAYGKADGTGLKEIPPIESIDRRRMLADLYGEGHLQPVQEK